MNLNNQNMLSVLTMENFYRRKDIMMMKTTIGNQWQTDCFPISKEFPLFYSLIELIKCGDPVEWDKKYASMFMQDIILHSSFKNAFSNIREEEMKNFLNHCTNTLSQIWSIGFLNKNTYIFKSAHRNGVCLICMWEGKRLIDMLSIMRMNSQTVKFW